MFNYTTNTQIIETMHYASTKKAHVLNKTLIFICVNSKDSDFFLKTTIPYMCF